MVTVWRHTTIGVVVHGEWDWGYFLKEGQARFTQHKQEHLFPYDEQQS